LDDPIKRNPCNRAPLVQDDDSTSTIDPELVAWLRRTRDAAASTHIDGAVPLNQSRSNALRFLQNVVHPVFTAFAWAYDDAFGSCHASVSPSRALVLAEHYSTVLLEARCAGDAKNEHIGFSAEIELVWRTSQWNLAGIASTSAGSWPLDLSWWCESTSPRHDFSRVLLMAWRRYEYAVRGVAVPHLLRAP
jgi:hypothetical protein